MKYESSTYSSSCVIGKFLRTPSPGVNNSSPDVSPDELKMTRRVILSSNYPCIITMRLGKKMRLVDDTQGITIQ